MSGSNTFGGTIKLEGEKEYRQAISQINSDLKVLASEMGKVTAEFGNEMDDTAKQTSTFGEALKANLAADFIKVGIKKSLTALEK
ncbi:MAG: hypothetical protein ACI4PR_05250 [Acutalibacteraceae bacterium]